MIIIKKSTNVGDELATKRDQTAVLLHCANRRGTIEAARRNVWTIAPDLAQSIASFVGTVLDDVDICEVWMRITNALHICSKCRKRILHTHVYRRKKKKIS